MSYSIYFWRCLRSVGFLSLMILPLFSLAQEYSLSGSVADSDEMPVASANVILLTKDKDSTTVDWGLTDDMGKYRIDNISSGEYILKIKSLGYKTKITEIEINRDITDYHSFLEGQMLDEVVVTQPRIEQKADRVVFNIRNTTLSDGDVWNALSQAPYLFNTGKQLLIKGRESPLIYINGRRSYLSAGEMKQLLESTPASLVKSVEIILSPPANFDAEGGAIVNIVMDKNLSVGYNGSIYGDYEQGVYPKYRIGTGHFYKRGKVNLYAGYTANIRKEYTFYRDEMRFFTDEMPSREWDSRIEEAVSYRSHNINTTMDYTINDKHAINVSGNVSLRPSFNEIKRSYTEAYDINQELDSLFYSVNENTHPRHNVGMDINYKYNISKGKELDASVRYTTYGYDNDQIINADYFDQDRVFMRNNAFTNDKEQNINLYTGQLDYSSSTDKSTFETGMNWRSITFDNMIEQRNLVGDNINLSNLFLYDESNFAAYLSYEYNWEKWDIKIGLRGEQTSIEGNSEGEINNQDYFKIFPSAYLTYKPADKHRFNISYNKKIDRPRFDILNPFRKFLNDNTYVTGNPNLLPTILQRFNITYTYDRWLTFSFYTRYSTNPIEQLPFVDYEENKLAYIDDNLDYNLDFGLDVLWSANLTSWWYFKGFFGVFHHEDHFFAIQNDNEILKNTRWGVVGQFGNNFRLSKDRTFLGDLALTYISETPKGNNIKGGWVNMTLGLRKTLWKRRATISFFANDVLGTRPYTSETQYLDQSIRSYTDFEYQTFEIGFTYRFGNYRLRNNRKSINEEERERL